LLKWYMRRKLFCRIDTLPGEHSHSNLCKRSMPLRLFRHLVKRREFPDALTELRDKFNEPVSRSAKFSHRFTELEVVYRNYGWNWDRLSCCRRPTCWTDCLLHPFPSKSSATKPPTSGYFTKQWGICTTREVRHYYDGGKRRSFPASTHRG
jgi:hypothetical protein